MLKKRARLTSREFDEVIKNGRISQSDFFSLRYHYLSGQAKISAVAPAKIVKTAVLRNGVRRKIYSALQSLYAELPRGIRMVIIAKNPALKAKSRELEPEIRNLFVKASILK